MLTIINGEAFAHCRSIRYLKILIINILILLCFLSYISHNMSAFNFKMRRGRGRERPHGPECLRRLQKDLDDLKALKGECQLIFPDINNIQKFILRIKIFQGLYQGHKFDFSFEIPDDWPYDKPNVKILTKCWHPNLTLEGDVCLNILRNNYVPTLTLQSYVPSLQFLFNEPNPTDPLNKEAASQYSQNYSAFKLKAEEYMDQYCPKD